MASLIASEIVGALTDPRMIRQLGAAFSEGMQKGGNASSFSAMDPTGKGRGVAGGRGERESLENMIKAKQLEHKLTNQLTKNLKVLNEVLGDSKKDMKSAWKNTARFSEVFTDVWGRAMDEVAKSTRSETALIKNLNDALDENVETLGDVLKIRQRHLILEERIAKAGDQASTRLVEEYNKLGKALGDSTHGIEDHRQSMLDNAKRGIRAFFSLEAAAINLARSFHQLVGDYRSQIEVGSRAKYLSSQFAAMSEGIDPQSLIEMMAASRQASFTFGSMDKYMSAVITQQEKYFNVIGDWTKAAKFATDMFMVLGKSGIRPNIKAMDRLGASFRWLNDNAAVTSEMFAQMVEQVTADTDVQLRLRVAHKDQRAAILAGITEQIRMNVAMGLTTEQAQAAALALGRIAGGGAKERFKRAAQIQMAGGAMGFQGAAELATLTRMGRQRMDPEQAKRFEELGTQFTEMATSFAGGTMPGELMRDVVMGDLESYFGKDSALNKQLAEGLELDQDGQAEIRANQTEQMDIWQKLLGSWDVVGNFLTSGLGGVITAAVQAAVGLYLLANIGTVALIVGAIMSGIVAAVPLIITALVGGVAIVASRVFAAQLSGVFDGFFGAMDRVRAFFGDDAAQERLDAMGPDSEATRLDEAKRQRDAAAEIQAKQLLQAEKQTAMQELQVKYNAQQITAIEFSARMQRISTMGSTPGLANT